MLDGFPTSVIVGGVEYGIDADFRTALDIMAAYEDLGLTWLDKQDITIAMLYGDNIPPDTNAAFDMAVFFLDCGEERQAGEDGEAPRRLYSFSHDARYIYSAIAMTHSIDLDSVKSMHWWRFCYLLQDLNEDCYFQRMLHLRNKYALHKLTKEEREEWRRNEKILCLPQYKDPEKEAAGDEFMARYRAAQARMHQEE